MNQLRNRLHWTPRKIYRELRMWMQRGLVVNPELSPGLELWDFLTASCLIWVGFIAPVQLALLNLHMDALFFVNCCIDLVFLVDMVLHWVCSQGQL